MLVEQFVELAYTGDMEISTPQFQPEEIDQAGRILIHVPEMDEDDSEWLEAAYLVNQWRAAHAHPLRVIRQNLRRRVNSRTVLAQRLKRLPTIITKLQRLPHIRLSQMQDIGGCRVVVQTSNDAFRLAADFAARRTSHDLIRNNNYIEFPRESGYRGLHLVYAYNSDRNKQWQGLRTEIQFRSRRQHQWATAVETVGAFVGQDLKSGLGDPTWLRFFALMGTLIAQREKTPSVPGTPTDQRELISEIRECEWRLSILEQLDAFRRVTRRLQDFRGKNYWVVIELNLETREVTGSAFPLSDEESAYSLYLEREVELQGDPRREVVLVSTDSLSALRRVFPNYFADLREFRKLVREILEKP